MNTTGTIEAQATKDTSYGAPIETHAEKSVERVRTCLWLSSAPHSTVGPDVKSTERRHRLATTAGYFATMVALGLAFAVIGPTLAGLARQTHSDIGEIGILFSALSVGSFLGSLLSGQWFDRLPGHRVLAIAVALLAVLVACVPSTSTLSALALTMLLMGAATATLDVGVNTLLLWSYRHRVGGVINALHFCFGLGALIAPAIVAGSIRTVGDFAVAYWVLAAAIAPIALCFIWLPAPPSPVRATTHFALPMDRRLVMSIATLFALYVAAEAGYGGWIATYAAMVGLADPANAALLTSAFWGMLTIGRLIAIPLANRYRADTVIAVDLTAAIVCVGAMLMDPESATTLWIATCLLGMSLASIFPMLLMFAGERMTVTGRSTSWYMAGGSAGGLVVPWLIGRMFAPFGPAVLLWAVIIDLLATTLLFVVTTRRSPRHHGIGGETVNSQN
jgi:FHS family Na+ dependent glucose MFS transporter 1